MRKFESIVMSENEPIMKMGTLWLKNKRDVIYNPDSKPKMKDSRSILFYGNKGWESFIDFDTRYDIETPYTYSVSDNPISMIRHSDEDAGIVTTLINYHLYNGNRNIANSSNFVLESGLKKHVDSLQGQINELEQEIIEIKTAITNINTNIGNINTAVNALSNRVSSLENN